MSSTAHRLRPVLAFALALTLLTTLATSAAEAPRVWHLRDSTKSVTATFIKEADGQVTLQRASDGRQFDTAIASLSDDDQAYITALRNGDADLPKTNAEALEQLRTEGDPPAQARPQTLSTEERQALNDRLFPRRATKPDTKGLLILLGLAILNIPIYLLLAKLFFENMHFFIESLIFVLGQRTPYNGRPEEDPHRFTPQKVGIWMLGCLIFVYGEYLLIVKFLFVS